MKTTGIILALALMISFAVPARASDGRLVVATTKSVKDSGLFDVLIPAYKKWTKLVNVDVRVVAPGSNKAVETARRGDADLLLLNDPEREDAFVREGYGDSRVEVMYNDFVIVGPKDDPADVSGAKDAPGAMRRIFDKGAPFVTRGDSSGTHAREIRLWKLADRDPARNPKYVTAGGGMAAAMHAADERSAYTLVDRATYDSMRWKLKKVRGMYQGGGELLNLYSAVAVSPQRNPRVNHKAALDFIEFITGRVGQKVIGDFRGGHGGALFVPDAKK